MEGTAAGESINLDFAIVVAAAAAAVGVVVVAVDDDDDGDANCFEKTTIGRRHPLTMTTGCCFR